MEGQMSLFKTEMHYAERIQKILEDLIVELELPKESLRIVKQDNKNDGEYVIEIFEPEFPEIVINGARKGVTSYALLLKEDHTKKNAGKLHLILFERVYNALKVKPKNCEIRNRDSSEYITCVFNEANDDYYNAVMEIVRTRVRIYESKARYGCCSQFKKCSEAEKCTHENKLYSTGCMYRHHLDAGRNFYKD